MNLLVSSLFWFVGLFLTSFTLIPVTIIFRFAIPFTRDLEKKDFLMGNHKIIKRYLISTVILMSVFLTFLFILYFTTSSGFKGFIGGSVISLLFGILKTGKNKENVSDYLETNKHYLRKDIEI